MTTITLSIFDNLNPTSAVSGVTVRIYNQAGNEFITQLVTDSAGEVTYDIPDATYWVRFYKKGYYFEAKTLIVVDEDVNNSWVITANDLTELPPSRADGICRVSGFIIDAQGAPSHLPIVTFSLPKDVRIMGDNIVGTEKVATQPNSDGYIEVELMQDAKYTVTMASISDDVIEVKVPKTQACSLSSLVYPSGRLSATPGAVSVTVDTKYETGVFVQASSGISLPDSDTGLSASSLVTIKGSSVKVACTVSSSNELVILASEAGVYTVEIKERFSPNITSLNIRTLGTFTVTASA